MNNALILIGSDLQGNFQQESHLMNKKELKKIKKMKIGKSQSSCSICHDQYSKGEIIRFLPCEHFFHYKCLKPWFKKSSLCPVCRFDIKKHLNDTASHQFQVPNMNNPFIINEQNENVSLINSQNDHQDNLQNVNFEMDRNLNENHQIKSDSPLFNLCKSKVFYF